MHRRIEPEICELKIVNEPFLPPSHSTFHCPLQLAPAISRQKWVPFMPTRRQLIAAGKADLVEDIMVMGVGGWGGQVACMLGREGADAQEREFSRIDSIAIFLVYRIVFEYVFDISNDI